MLKRVDYFINKIKKQKINAIIADSRIAKSNNLFFTLDGNNCTGNDFIYQAIEHGAQYIITNTLNHLRLDTILSRNIKIGLVNDTNLELIKILDIFYPKMPKYLVGATGTNGKTSVVSYCKQLFALLGESSASIGTIGVKCSNDNKNVEKFLTNISSLTTPDIITIRYILNTLAINNINYIAIEASSHGLVQNRLSGLKIHSACITSFSHDHLDYHKNMEDYLLAKLNLFTENLLPNSFAILNSDIEELNFIKEFLKKSNIPYITVGKHGEIKIIDTNSNLTGQTISFLYKKKLYNFNTSIIGSFQATNLLLASMMVCSLGFSFEKIIQKLPYIKGVEGRLQRIKNSNIFIDYAHTPDGLKQTLNELQKILPYNGKLKVVFGCGGDRDFSKRQKMGSIASMIANEIIITDDNPRTENPNKIRKDIISGINNSQYYIEIPNRKEAINYSIKHLKKNDILVIAGKGHEKYQILGTKQVPFNDYLESKKCLHKKSY